jgi:Uncharacterized small protein (DUF2292).
VPKTKNIPVSEKEEKLLELIRAVKFGEIKVFIQESEPIRVEKITESIKL